MLSNNVFLPRELWSRTRGENVADKFPPTALSTSNSETLLHRLLVTDGKSAKLLLQKDTF